MVTGLSKSTDDVSFGDGMKAFAMNRGPGEVGKSYITPRASIVRKLTKREREILGWMAHGKSYWETGEILGIAEGTVRIHLASIRRKLDATNTTNAVAKALYRGAIIFIPR